MLHMRIINVGRADMTLQGSIGPYLTIHLIIALILISGAYLRVRDRCRLSFFSRLSTIGTDAL